MSVSEEGHAVGLFGGTFDPVHQGHLDLARHVLDRCRLDRLLFIPAPLPPHKRQPAASFAHRVAMIEAALAECPGDSGCLRCSCVEQNLPLPSYTIHTVEALIKAQGGHRFFLIIGADSLLDLPHWHRIDQLLALVNLIVVNRDRITTDKVDMALGSLDASFKFDAQHGLWIGRGERTVEYLDDIELPVSSSSIREELAQGKVPAMLPPAVFDYIKQYHLYGWRAPL
ncbi:nicotinate (nicotinamide) nucleotide adenylyltransferase [uncultured Desulfobulbus sp.]|uniref:nicotinate (nicotinamide) nucleotide adenylyltransferase n=1 Tax=uncultured Desulfobulbus sp. TaxID=239745 RepID=UPI00374CBB8B